jgi:hypothetical protein
MIGTAIEVGADIEVRIASASQAGGVVAPALAGGCGGCGKGKNVRRFKEEFPRGLKPRSSEQWTYVRAEARTLQDRGLKEFFRNL